MKKELTEIVFLLDRSGSMSGLEKDTIGGFNSMIKKQKKDEGKAYVSTVLFDDHSEVLHNRVSMKKVPAMTEEEYYVRGCTALLDAIGDAIHHIGTLHKYASKKERPSKTLFIITTDGLENASHRYSYDTVKKMIERQQTHFGWEFLFIGANMDAIAEASKLGIKANRAVDYISDDTGTSAAYEAITLAVKTMRAAPSVCSEQALTASNWAAGIQSDYKKRSKKSSKKKI